MSEQITPNPSVPTQVVAEVSFPKVINALGIIPTSYKDSMSYYETLAWLCKYLEETVIPSVNQNGNAVQELQNLYIQLNDYVTHYFDTLDVQEEINRKLDEMTASGYLQILLSSQYDELRNEVNNEIVNFEDTINSQVRTINVKVNNAVSGSPAGVYDTFADLEADDPDHDRIYVIKVNGKWYYWDTTTELWTQGGDYQSALITEDDPVIQKIETRIDDFSEQTNIVKDIFYATLYNNGTNYVIYPRVTDLTISFPITSGKTYTVYKGFPMTLCRYAFSENVPALNGVVTDYAEFTSTGNYKTFTATDTGYAVVKILDASETTLDINVVKSSIYVYEGKYTEEITKQTTLLKNIRKINDLTYNKIKKSVDSVKDIDLINDYLIAQVTASAVTISNDSSKLSIIFPVIEGKTYTIDKKVFTYHTRTGFFESDNYPKGGAVPDEFIMLDGGNGCEHVTFTSPLTGYCCSWILDRGIQSNITIDWMLSHAVAYKGTYQEDITRNSYNIEANNIQKVFYCGANRSLSTLKAGIEEATKYMNAILHVDPGIYDLIQEFGNDYFESLIATSSLSGLVLKNNVHVIFDVNSKVVSNYTGDNQYARSLYSPFNAGIYGFTIENLNLECSNCRYGIHDERNGASEEYYSHLKNCNIYIDNSNNTDWQIHHCIGGGLGANANVLIENCTFNDDDPDERYGVYYHISNSTTNTNYKANVTIKDNYFIAGTVTLDNVASSPDSTAEDSIYIVTNNRFPTKYTGTNDEGVYNGLTRNYQLYNWNNKIG